MNVTALKAFVEANPFPDEPVPPEGLVELAPWAWDYAEWALQALHLDWKVWAERPIREMVALCLLVGRWMGREAWDKLGGPRSSVLAPVALGQGMWKLDVGAATSPDPGDVTLEVTLEVRLPTKLLKTRTGEGAVTALAKLMWAQLNAPPLNQRLLLADPEARLAEAVAAWAQRGTPDAAWVGQKGEA